MQNFIRLLLFLTLVTGCAREDVHDYVILNGAVYVGDGSAAQAIDIAMIDGRISFVGDAQAAGIIADRTLDAGGLVVSPGFIDPHTHSLDDLSAAETSLNKNYLTQGVTTVLTGNDGRGPIEIEQALAVFSETGVGTNVGLFTGHNTIREHVMGMANRPPTTEQLTQMKVIVREAMDQGAFGFSTGLYYAPGSFAETAEVIALASELKNSGGVYESHIRDESSYSVGLLTAVQEAIEVGKQSGAPVHIAHIKALGVDVWGQSEEVIAMVENARENGVIVTADQYPWSASGTRISNALIPNWAKADSKEKLIERLQNPALQQRLDNEIAENLRKRGGGAALLITGGYDTLEGQTLDEVASGLGMTEVGAAKHIVMNGDARVASFNMRDTDIENFMSQPWVMTSSDGTRGHPRKYASFPRKFSVYVKEKKLLSLADFIHRSTGLPADTFGICGRGYLKEGYAADIVIFDPEAFVPEADYSNPEQLSQGVNYLFVNGALVIDQGRLESVKTGEALRRGAC